MNATWKRVAVIIAVFVPVAVIGAFVMKQDKDDVVVTSGATPAVTVPATTTPVVTTPTISTGTEAGTTTGTTATKPTAPTATTSYTNGTYSAVGQYGTPEGQQSITVTLSVDNDVVKSVTVVAAATGEASKRWQTKFINGVQAQVVGKKLASLHLTNVSGSSLTPAGFNTAVSDIQNQAKN